MTPTEKPTRVERIKRQIANNPVAAWLIVAATILVSASTLIPSTKSVIHDLGLTSPLPPLHVTVAPFDPRFSFDSSTGRRMNWGGGSQALFIETARPVLFPEADDSTWHSGDAPTYGILDSLRTRQEVKRVWEIVPPYDGAPYGLTIDVNTVYDASPGASTCVILEWGIVAEPAPLPANGFYIAYGGGGGADAPREGGDVTLPDRPGSAPIALWREMAKNADTIIERHRPPERVQYLKPGDPIFLRVNVFSRAPRDSDFFFRSNPRPSVAWSIAVYAKVLVDGKEWLLKSNPVRAVVLDGSNDWQLDEDDAIENLRPSAYK